MARGPLTLELDVAAAGMAICPLEMTAVVAPTMRPAPLLLRLRRRRLLDALFRARARLDRPPLQALGTSKPSREELIAHLKSAGRRFAREYWADGLPLFFPGIDLGPVPEEFIHVCK